MRRSLLFLSMYALIGASSAAAEDAPEPEPRGKEAVEIIAEEPGGAEPTALAHNAALLDELLQQSSALTIREKKLAAAAGITGGATLLGLATWRLVENEPHNAYTRGLGVMFMTLGMVDLTTGVYAATRVPTEKRRLERWKAARENGITEVELAHFEGELQASKELRQGERMLVRWNGLTHAIAGALVLALTPVPDGSNNVDRVSGYIIGSIFIATGMGAFGASYFRKPPSETAWEEYNKRKMPMPGHEFSWRLAPSISRRGAGVSFGATF